MALACPATEKHRQLRLWPGWYRRQSIAPAPAAAVTAYTDRRRPQMPSASRSSWRWRSASSSSSSWSSSTFFVIVITATVMSEFLVEKANADCFIGKAIADTELCSNTFQGMFEKKDESGKDRKFNSTNPADLREACCSMERLERCLQAASTDAGCRDEVRFIVEHMSSTARRLIYSLYKIRCNKVDCSSAGRGRTATWSPSLLVAVAVAVLLFNRVGVGASADHTNGDSIAVAHQSLVRR